MRRNTRPFFASESGKRYNANGSSGSRLDNAADDADQCRLARTIGAEQGKNLAAFYLQVDFFECLETAGIGLLTPRTEMMGTAFSAVMVADVGILFMD